MFRVFRGKVSKQVKDIIPFLLGKWQTMPVSDFVLRYTIILDCGLPHCCNLKNSISVLFYIVLPYSIQASIAQLVEQRIRNAQVKGSSPFTSLKPFLLGTVFFAGSAGLQFPPGGQCPPPFPSGRAGVALPTFAIHAAVRGF